MKQVILVAINNFNNLLQQILDEELINSSIDVSLYVK